MVLLEGPQRIQAFLGGFLFLAPQAHLSEGQALELCNDMCMCAGCVLQH